MSLYLSRQGIISGGAAAEPDSLLTDLIAWWELDEKSGTRYDAHTGGYDLTDNGTVQVDRGDIGYASYHVSANAEYLSRTDEAGIRVGDEDWSMSFTYIPANLVFQAVLAKDDTDNRGFVLYISGSKFVFAVFDLDQVASASLTHSQTLVIKQKYRVYIWHDSVNDLIGMRIDDANEETVSTAAITPRESTAPLTFGALIRNPVYANCWLDNIKYFRRLLTSEEITRCVAPLRYPNNPLSPVTITDAFTDTDAVLLNNHTPNAGPAGYSLVGVWDILSNQARLLTHGTATGQDQHYWDAEASDVDFSCDISSAVIGPSDAPAILIRGGYDGFWKYALYNTGTTLTEYDYIANTSTSRGSTTETYSINTPYQMRAVANGSNIDCYFDGEVSPSISYASATRSQNATLHGLGLNRANASKFDNLSIVPL